nr:sulfhydryl oxidase 2-like isoform X2 [Ipomoea batatas]
MDKARSVLEEMYLWNLQPNKITYSIIIDGYCKSGKIKEATRSLAEMPHYEKVARLFNGADAIHPGIILMTRVDCALGINSNLCDKFSVGHYPMLFWDPPSKFVGGSWKPKLQGNRWNRLMRTNGTSKLKLVYKIL